MTVGILFMCAYGVLVAHFWGARKTLDIALVAAIVCVFPYMAQVYQYNSVMVAYPLAHLLAAAAVVLAARARALSTAAATVLFFLAFSIYQAVLANAATIFLGWLLTRTLFAAGTEPDAIGRTVKAAAAALIAVTAGGIMHVLAVMSLDIPFDAAQGADQAFSLRSRLQHGLQLSYAVHEALQGTRAFFVWPEAYLPQSLKLLQGLLVTGAALTCLWSPRSALTKVTACLLLGFLLLSPRVMQFLHPQGSYHALTLTAYALVIAVAALVLMRARQTVLRNAAAVATVLLLAGYVVQSSWISTVNYLNTLAHYSTMTQILARLRSLPDQQWDGKKVAVVGGYSMPTGFPFAPATGVAVSYMRPRHMNRLARLMRDEATFVESDATMPKVLDYAAKHRPWPSPESVALVDGTAVVVLSPPARPEERSSSR
jgi:hypothetical protein